MSNNTTNQETTFWNFLQNNTIEIPIIQRDYAQGREGKEELRETFLGSLKNALDKPEQKLTLDFVYGSKENDRFNPLDGQQRLTTLWLLHWYVAYKADKLKDECVSDRFKKFTYETRVSSREFCERLAEFNIPKLDCFDGTISKFIQQQTWFYSAWKQDPTIQSMLRMLDDLERMFTEDYWDLLYGENCPISFYNLDLGELKLTDDLYIKMNARGEQLTSFENFKADLIGYVREQKWDKLIDAQEGIPIKMDTTWTDIFWKNNVDGKIDDIYFAFLNRFFLNEFICIKKTDDQINGSGNPDYNKTARQIEDDLTFRLLYGDKSDDSKVFYQSFEKYKDCITQETLDSLQKTLNNFAQFIGNKRLNEINELFQPNWSKGKDGNVVKVFDFIPRNENETITTLTQTQRILFYAICKYFEYDKRPTDENDSFKHWMRVVWNLVENGNINTIDSMVGNMRLIDELSEHSHDIYTFLTSDNPKITSTANKEQLKEEIEKAKQILDNEKQLQSYPGTIKEFKDKTWEDVIIIAENYAFFKGSIRFLFHDSEGKPNWDDFYTKWAKAQKYFDKDGIKKEYKVAITKALVIQCSDWHKQLYDKQIFNPNAATWKWILCANNWILPIHNILMADNLDSIVKTKSMNNENVKNNILPIIENIPFVEIINEIPEGRFRWNRDRLAIYKPRGQDAIVFDGDVWQRNKILSEAIGEGKITSDQKIEGCNFFWGWDIKFIYKKDGADYHFKWNTDGNIYLLDDKWNRRIRDNADVKIDTSKVENLENLFIGELGNLIGLYNKDCTPAS